MLFNKLLEPDRSQTQLAYMINYYPSVHLPDHVASKFIAWSKRLYLPKERLLELCNESMTSVQLLTSPTQFKIQWAFNNVPTEIEWNRKSSNYLIGCEFRVSAITGPIVVLSFGTVKHMDPTYAN